MECRTGAAASSVPVSAATSRIILRHSSTFFGKIWPVGYWSALGARSILAASSGPSRARKKTSVITPDPPAGRADVAAAAYEELRSHVLSDSPRRGRFGLVLLLREGIASWIDRCVTCSAPVAASAAPDRAVSAPLVSQQLQADIVSVLASIALTGREEMRL